MGRLGEKGEGDIVNNIVITMYGASWVLEISGEHFVKYMTNHSAEHLKLIQNTTEYKS